MQLPLCAQRWVHVLLSPPWMSLLTSSEPQFSSVQFSCSVMSNSFRPHGLQHTRVSCPSPTPIAQPVLKLPEWVSATHGLRSSVEFKPPVNSCKYIHCQKAKCQLFHLTWTATREQPIGISLGFLSIPRELHSSEIILRK